MAKRAARATDAVEGDLVAVYRSHDPVLSRQIAELLRTEGMEVATPGLEHRSMVGALGGYVEIVILVPEPDAARARDVIAALDAGEPAPEPPEEPATYRSGAASTDEAVGGIRLRRVAFVAAWMIPGGGHLYARRYRQGLSFLVVGILGWLAFTAGVPLAILFWPVLLAFDLWGAFRLCAISQGTMPRESERTYAPGIGALVILGGLGICAGPLATSLAGPDAAVCRWNARCDEQAELRCVLRAADARLDGLAPAQSAACGACLDESECGEADRCADVCEF